MSMVTVSEKKGGRVYERKFDHDLAQEMHAAGVSYRAIARELGVTARSVARVCDPAKRAEMNKRTQEWMRACYREPCRSGCGALVWMNCEGRSGLCHACFAAAKTAEDEREGELRCTRCREWKPDSEFRLEKRQTRRGRSSQCRTCESAARRDHRQRNIEAQRNYDRQRNGGLKTMATEYRVLALGEDQQWRELAKGVMASSPAQAVERTVSGAGTYVAFGEGTIVDVEQVVQFKAVSRRGGSKRDARA